MSHWKRKRYYIDHSHGDRLIFITSGRKNVFVRSPEMRTTERVSEREIGFPVVEFQDEHPLSGYNMHYVEDYISDLTECGVDTSYRFFWKYCVKSTVPYPGYDSLFRNLKLQRH